MAILEIKRAAERHLSNLSPAVSTAWEGASFNPPANQMYQRVQFLIRPVTDPVLGKGFHRENLSLQVFIAGMANKGSAEVLARAELVREHFAKGTTFLESGIRVHVLRTPQISGTSISGDRIICPVLIELVAEVYS